MVYTFNELSLINKASSIEHAMEIIDRLVRSCTAATKMGLGDLRLNQIHLPNLYSIPIYDNYDIGKWLKDDRVNEDIRIRFKEIVTSVPLIQETEQTEIDLYKQSEFKKELDENSHEVWGLGAAYVFDTLSLSLATHTLSGTKPV